MILACALAIAFQPGEGLGLRLEKGDVIAGEMRLRYSNGDFEMIYRDRIEWHVTAVAADGKRVFERTRTNLETKMDGQNLPFSSQKTTAPEQREATGTLLIGEGYQPLAVVRTDRALNIPAPRRGAGGGYRRLGDSVGNQLPAWTEEGKWRSTQAVDRLELDEITTTWRERRDVGAQVAEGRWLIDPVTGWPASFSMTVTNAPMPGGEGDLYRLEIAYKTLAWPARLKRS